MIETAIALTADQLGRADFDGAGDQVLAKLSSTAIAMSKKFLPEHEGEGGIFAKLGARSVVAATLRAVQLLGRQFVLGQTIDAAMDEAASAKRKTDNLRYSYDMLGEAALTEHDAQRYMQAYENAIHAIGKTAKGKGVVDGPGISIKLSALHPRYSRMQHARVLQELLPRVLRLADLARHYDIGLNIDAEEADRLELSLDLLEALCLAPRLQG